MKRLRIYAGPNGAGKSSLHLVMEVTPQKDIVWKSKRIPIWIDEYILSRLQ